MKLPMNRDQELLCVKLGGVDSTRKLYLGIVSLNHICRSLVSKQKCCGVPDSICCLASMVHSREKTRLLAISPTLSL